MVMRKFTAQTSVDAHLFEDPYAVRTQLPNVVAGCVGRLLSEASRHNAQVQWESMELRIRKTAFGSMDVRVRAEAEAER